MTPPTDLADAYLNTTTAVLPTDAADTDPGNIAKFNLCLFQSQNQVTIKKKIPDEQCLV